MHCVPMISLAELLDPIVGGILNAGGYSPLHLDLDLDFDLLDLDLDNDHDDDDVVALQGRCRSKALSVQYMQFRPLQAALAHLRRRPPLLRETLPTGLIQEEKVS